jgi:nitrite reductase (NO-forming)
MYHCGTPMILEHLIAGMYGMTVVAPRGGYPTKVDREYAVVQSEFYLKPGNGKDGLSELDIAAAKIKHASQVAFNGHVSALRDKPLAAKPGERVRLYVLNVGPSDTSSFHVVGTIFDRVWIEGNPLNQFRGMQTVLLGASNSAVVEFVVAESGKYIMVDHEFADATNGAIGLIDATGGAQAPSGATGMSDADKGKALFASSACGACHVPAQGAPRIAPDLAGVTTRRSDEWLAKWLSDVPGMLANDAEAKKLLEQWKVMMPPTGMSPEQVKQLIAHFHAQDGGGHDHGH